MIRPLTRLLWTCAGAAALGVTGCAGTYDLVTSQRFRANPFGTLFTSEDPILVLESNPEGDERVRAMNNLKEPARHGGSAAEQDKVIGILQTSATTDRRSFCRLAAVKALADFEDPRCVPILLAAYRNSPFDAPPEFGTGVAQAGGNGRSNTLSTFTPETVTVLQCRIVETLGKHRHPEALKLLCEIALNGAVKPAQAVEQAGFLGEHMGPTESNRMDVQLAAIRALGNYAGDDQAAQVLITVMQREKDVAIRGRTHEALVSVTGQDLPADAPAWVEWQKSGGKMRKAGLFR